MNREMKKRKPQKDHVIQEHQYKESCKDVALNRSINRNSICRDDESLAAKAHIYQISLDLHEPALKHCLIGKYSEKSYSVYAERRDDG